MVKKIIQSPSILVELGIGFSFFGVLLVTGVVSF